MNTNILDRWLGWRLPSQSEKGDERFTAIISSAQKDEHHPKNAVVRAMMHRGGKVVTTEGKTVCSGKNAPQREGWRSAAPLAYPQEQES